MKAKAKAKAYDGLVKCSVKAYDRGMWRTSTTLDNLAMRLVGMEL